jgi:hypothetical protein
MASIIAGPLRLAERFLGGLIVLNYFYGTGILAMLVASFLVPGPLFHALGVRLVEGAGTVIGGARLIMVAGLVSVPLHYLVLTRLLAIVRTVQGADPFVVENAERLRSIAWAVLALEVVHLVIGAIVFGLGASGQPLGMKWSFSFTPWLAVLLLFVLAQVFDHGARLRADLEGTV